MKFTLSWLKDYLDTDKSLEEICDRLTAIGLELEGLEDPAATFAPFKVAYVTDAKPHPDADKLQILSVKTADQDGLQVVCGAPNARKGMKGIFAPEGTYIPGLDVTLKKTKIRGVESNGMMVSEKEMCLSDEHAGIIEVDNSFEVGTPMADVFGLNDPIIEIGLTPNRADCAGIYGIARDLAAAGMGTLIKPDTKAIKGSLTSDFTLDVQDSEGCPHFIAREIRGVKNGPSPEWLQRRLKAIGLRPISALVDITNFFTHGFARPLHVFDADKLKGGIQVRAAKGTEKLEALDDKTYTLSQNAVGVYDDSGIIGMGGIIGGTSTGCGDDTVNVILECAYFKPERIARAGRDTGVISDARYRFERGVDPAFTAPAVEMATRMILEICGNEDSKVSQIIEAGSAPEWERTITYKPSLMSDLIGYDMKSEEQLSILQALGFQISGAMMKDGPYSIKPPSWRGDIFGPADLTEEIIRIEGLDKITPRSVFAADSVPPEAETLNLSRARKTRSALAVRGMHECVTWSFLSDKAAQTFGLTDDAQRAKLTLRNAISSEIDVMRPSILPNLIQAAIRNGAQGYGNVALFEVGPVFEGTNPDEQKVIASGLRAGSNHTRHWSDANAARGVDVYDAKADALAALEAAGAPTANAQISRDAPDYFHPGRSGAIRLGKNVLAYFGELHPAALQAMNAKTAMVGFEVFLDAIPPSRNKGTEKPYLTLEPLQPLSRDFAFLVDKDVAADDVVRAAKAADKKLITDANVFDVYVGKGVDESQKSLALSITIQPKGESLSDKDIEALMQKVIDIVEKKAGGVLRS